MAQFNVSVQGEVPEEEINRIVETIAQLYRKSPFGTPSSLEIVVVDTISRREKIMKEEEKKLGIKVSEDYPVTHEAWWGTPRIVACVESLTRLAPIIARASILVAAAHSILHGSQEYYRYRLSPEAVRRGREKGWDVEHLERFLYLVASGIKNLAVAKLLVRCGFVPEHINLALDQLDLEESEKSLWKFVEGNAIGRALYLASLLKNILFAYPSIPYAPYLATRIQEITSHLSASAAWQLRSLGIELAQTFPGDSKSFFLPAFERAWSKLVEGEIF